MNARKLIPPTLLALSLGTGCQHAAAADPASSTAASPQAPAPFASPPVLAGTPDIATLAAKVRPSVVNITTVHAVKVPRGDFGFPEMGNLFPFFRQPYGRHAGPREQG